MDGGEKQGLLNTFSDLFIVGCALQVNTCYVLLLLLTISIRDHLPPPSRTWQQLLRRTPPEQLQSPIDLVTTSNERKFYRPNSRAESALPNSNSDRNYRHNKHASMSVFDFILTLRQVSLFHWIEK